MQEKQLQIEAKFFKGLADKSRLNILERLIEEDKTVNGIVEATGLSQPNVSMHLSCLLECGLVERKRDGRQVRYSVATADVKELIGIMRKIVSQHAEDILKCVNY